MEPGRTRLMRAAGLDNCSNLLFGSRIAILEWSAPRHSHYGQPNSSPSAIEAVRLLQQWTVYAESRSVLQEGQMRSIVECRRLLQRHPSWRQATCGIQSAASCHTDN